MINASLLRRPGLTASIDPLLVRRHRALRIAPSAGFTEMPIADLALDLPAASTWRDDLRFFAGCYIAGLIFFLIILS